MIFPVCLARSPVFTAIARSSHFFGSFQPAFQLSELQAVCLFQAHAWDKDGHEAPTTRRFSEVAVTKLCRAVPVTLKAIGMTTMSALDTTAANSSAI